MSFIFGDKPTPPDPTQTANAQQGYNLQAGQTQNQINSYGQSNPYGNMNYVADPSSPSGYRINTSLSAPLQSIFNTQTGTIGNLAQNTAGMYSHAPNFQALDPSQIAGTLNSWSQKYQQPLFDQQSSNLEAQLRNQGLAPGTTAYDNAKNLLARNQGDVTNQYLTSNLGNALQAQQQNFGQQVTNYQTPLQTMGALEGTIPGNPTFAQSPTAQIQPANYAGIAEQNYQSQNQNYQNNVNNIAKLGTSAASLAFAPLTSGTSLMGMFGNGLWNSSGFGNSSPSYGNFGQYSPNAPMNAV